MTVSQQQPNGHAGIGRRLVRVSNPASGEGICAEPSASGFRDCCAIADAAEDERARRALASG
jgi:hypothetical protein